MILTKAYDVEILPNFFSVTFISIDSYLKVFKDCVNSKGKPIPLTQCLSVDEIKNRLVQVERISFWVSDTDDSQLLDMVSYIADLKPSVRENVPIRNDLFGYNSSNYDSYMLACLLMYYSQTNSTKELIKVLYDTSKKLIDNQKDKDYKNKDFFLSSLKEYKLPYIDIDIMRVLALNKVGKGVDKDGNDFYIPKSLKQTSINIQWWEILEHELPPISEADAHFYTSNPRYRNFTPEQLDKLIDKWDRYIIPEWIDEMLRYNENDVFIVCEIVRLFIEEVKLRYTISNAYKVNVLSSSRSDIADRLFIKFYSDFTNLDYRQWGRKKTERTKMSFKRVIEPSIRFKTPEMQALLEELKGITITSVGKEAFSKTIEMFGVTYNLATGGIHTKDIPGLYKSRIRVKTDEDGNPVASFPTGEPASGASTYKKLSVPIAQSDLGYNWENLTDDSYIYVHADVASFYPSIMVNYKIAPEHLNESMFVKLVDWLKNTRVEAKHSKEPYIDGVPAKLLAEVLKIVINSIYGKLGYKFGDLYDRLAVLRVTVNGQLLLLMLCEALEVAGINVISANTDGIVIKVPARKKMEFDTILEEWSRETGFQLDSEIYDSYICRDVNNYLCREINGSVTYKGALNPELYIKDLSKGYNAPIVAEAVSRFLLDDKDVMETLHECKDILMFCKTQNIGRAFDVSFNLGNKSVNVQRNTRYYISLNGGILEKVNGKTRVNLCSGKKVTILNTLDDEDIANKDINYFHYYTEAHKIIAPIKLGISPSAKPDKAKGFKSGKAILKSFGLQYNNLFEDNDDD